MVFVRVTGGVVRIGSRVPNGMVLVGDRDEVAVRMVWVRVYLMRIRVAIMIGITTTLVMAVMIIMTITMSIDSTTTTVHITCPIITFTVTLTITSTPIAPKSNRIPVDTNPNPNPSIPPNNPIIPSPHHLFYLIHPHILLTHAYTSLNLSIITSSPPHIFPLPFLINIPLFCDEVIQLDPFDNLQSS